MMALRHRKWFVILMTFLLTMLLMTLLQKAPSVEEQPIQQPDQRVKFYMEWEEPSKIDKNWRGLTDNETRSLSVLGRILFLEEHPPQPRQDRKFTILVWKYGKSIENRHLRRFGAEEIDPFDSCSVNNCQLTYSDSAINTADLVIFHLHRMKQGEMPVQNPRIKTQLWAFLTDESPHHTFLSSANHLSDYNGFFNWSMTYRMDSDIPVPYGRTVPRRAELERQQPMTWTKRRDVLVAIMGSNCGGINKRWDYVKELQKHITVDVYGSCGQLKECPGHFKSDCNLIGQYQFYLSFENSNCDGYVTEKVWWNGYEKNSIPIVMGASPENYKKILPPGSYLNVDDFAHPKDLAGYLLYLNASEKLSEFYQWRRDFQVGNEHGYFGWRSWHYCRACEALNYNDLTKGKVYDDLSQFWSEKRDCHPAWNA